MMCKYILFVVLLPSIVLAGTCPTSSVYGPNGNSTLSSLGALQCYYISNTGNDGSSGANESSPWAHSPTMKTWTGSHSVIAGDAFIFKNGDTWTAADLAIVATGWAGTSSHPIYITNDPTWGTGSFPTFTCDGVSATPCTASGHPNAQIYVDINSPYVVTQNIELTGLYQNNQNSSGTVGVFLGANGDAIYDSYFHGWYRVSAQPAISAWSFDGTNNVVTFTVANSFGVSVGQVLHVSNLINGSFLNYPTASLTVCGTGTAGCSNPTTTTITATGVTHATSSATENGIAAIQNTNDIILVSTYTGGGGIATHVTRNVIDGVDSTQNTGMGISSAGDATNNYIRYVYNGINGWFDTISGNLIEHVDFYSTSGNHTNGIYHKTAMNASGATIPTISIHDNVIRNSSAAGSVVNYNNADCVGNSANANTCHYNNVFYGWLGIDAPMVTAGGDGNSCGNFYFYNDTIVTPDNTYGIGNGLNTGTNNAYVANIHLVNSNGVSGNVCSGGTAVTCHEEGGEVLQTAAQANANTIPHFDQYSASETYPYSPLAATNSTVAAGLTAAQLTAFLPAACPVPTTDTALAVGYDSVSHKVIVPGRASINRPASSNYDVGAYQFVNPFGTFMSPNTLTTSGTTVH